MPDNKDLFDLEYTEKLWKLLPEVYRALDSNDFASNGPLREVVNRIGAQAAIIRRSIDRLWEDQSIESCDDWAIPYIADILATNLVSSMDSRGQRLDVAKTIYYRRRKGTLGLLEELASDVTGWDVRCAEFFRRLARTRHSVDPEVGLPSETDDPIGGRQLQLAEGIIGKHSGTAIGGTANLRNVYSGTRSQTAFDEFFHTADMRRGEDLVGWHNIPHLGVFVWRLYSFGVGETQPVRVKSCPGQYAVDPTGRDIQLFASSSRNYGDTWKSPDEWQVPTPLDFPLLETYLKELYAAFDPINGVSVFPNAMGIYIKQGSFFDLLPVTEVTADVRDKNKGFLIDPTRGRLIGRNNVPTGDVRVRYHYGFSSTIGAGTYDRRVLGLNKVAFSGPEQTAVQGGAAFATALTGVGGSGTVTIEDSLTYDSVSDVPNITELHIQSKNGERPLIRLPASPPASVWTFTGAIGADPNTPSSMLVLDGLFVSGADIALAGSFDTVLIDCCTLDPGDYDFTNLQFNKAVDDRVLLPCQLRMLSGTAIRQLIINRSIVGPIVVEGNGRIETMQITDSIVQGLGGVNAIASGTGTLNIARSTVLGKVSVHRLDATECIFDAPVTVIDQQHGCVRFCAVSTTSVVPRTYESVTILPNAPLFTSRVFAHPGYCQLLEDADREIIPNAAPLPATATQPTISTGAQNGSEMGAFAREKQAIKTRSLLIKFKEYMPLGITPTVINVT